MEDGGKSLFALGKKGRGLGSKPQQANKAKIVAEKVPFKINISSIGASLQLQNFEFLYSQMFKKIKGGKQNPVNDREFHSAL